MGIVTFNDTFISTVPAPKLFKALIVEPENYVVKVAPQFVKGYDIIEGTGGPGSVKKVSFPEGAPVTYAKHKVDVFDKDNLYYVETVFEGDVLPEKVISITHEIKFESSADGGCVNNVVIKYNVKDGAELTEEDVKPAKEAAHGIFKAVEAYLLANPDA